MMHPLTLVSVVLHKPISLSPKHDTPKAFGDGNPYLFNKPIELEKVRSEKAKQEIQKKIKMIKHKDLRARLYLSEEELNSLKYEIE